MATGMMGGLPGIYLASLALDDAHSLQVSIFVYAAGTHLVRVAGWAVAPTLAGVPMAGTSLAAPPIAGGLLKLLYDLVLWRAFRKLRPPEESG